MAHSPDVNLPSAHHTERRNEYLVGVAALDSRERQLSLLRLLLFLAGAVTFGRGVWARDATWITGGALTLLAFAAAVVVHAIVLKRRERQQLRAALHERHLKRLSNEWREFNESQLNPYGPEHPYAHDIDLAGQGSLLQRINTCHTTAGVDALAGYLSAPPALDEIHARQAAVKELAQRADFRYEFEARGLEGIQDAQGSRLPKDGGPPLLSGASFAQFAELKPFFGDKPWLLPLMLLLPVVTLCLFLGGRMGVVSQNIWLFPLSAQVLIAMSAQGTMHKVFNLGSARQATVEAFERMLALAEVQEFESPLLQQLTARLRSGNRTPSTHMAALRKWVSLGEFRQQFLLWALVNPLVFWDLHVLRGMERWIREAGVHTADWFAVLAELEALCALAALHTLEPDSTFPEVTAAETPMHMEGLGHPLLRAEVRIENDLSLRGPGTALIVTGSNMAGKSTLLRSVGLNMALALAGGPVIARNARIPLLRLRASMRAQDNLQEGASYFRAELNKLRSVVEGAEQAPPVFFLLDELLRGTNERARHVGAKAVVLHLLHRRGSGLVATHDVALAALERTNPERIHNVHFTDTMRDGEMLFDYQLRPGIVQTSNALRLLALAGIEIPEDAEPPAPTAPRDSQAPQNA